MHLLKPNQQRQSTQGTSTELRSAYVPPKYVLANLTFCFPYRLNCVGPSDVSLHWTHLTFLNYTQKSQIRH